MTPWRSSLSYTVIARDTRKVTKLAQEGMVSSPRVLSSRSSLASPERFLLVLFATNFLCARAAGSAVWWGGRTHAVPEPRGVGVHQPEPDAKPRQAVDLGKGARHDKV